MFKKTKSNNRAVDALLGVAVGDALGVPYEFYSREFMDKNPATGMAGYGTHGQPAGTWSDDTSLTLCLADALTEGYDLINIAAKFVEWRYSNLWTANGSVFDIGNTTSNSIDRLKFILQDGKTEQFSKLKNINIEVENGNGSLMRILPLLFYVMDKSLDEQFYIIKDVSALTHRHVRAAMACHIYLYFAEQLLSGKDKNNAYTLTQNVMKEFFSRLPETINECDTFKRILASDIRLLKKDDIISGGYVVNTLEAALWCFLKEDNFKKALLSSVNLGGDTDTTAAVCGGLAGIYYGCESIPEEWLSTLARKNEIIDLANRIPSNINL